MPTELPKPGLTTSITPAKPIASKTPADYGVDMAPRVTTLNVTEPPKRSAGVKVKTVDELIGKLKAAGAIA